ncbi:uncharacterized protein LOC120315865 [Crotalus tigris]|uniref:uncharacterized protein LOC120315865 n=1 Tax=Crotalus tigris TaxID=88082 RepID=UPI00192F90F2|nr:uncharacterized protein LOC120315865 [Crotalus tigris]
MAGRGKRRGERAGRRRRRRRRWRRGGAEGSRGAEEAAAAAGRDSSPPSPQARRKGDGDGPACCCCGGGGGCCCGGSSSSRSGGGGSDLVRLRQRAGHAGKETEGPRGGRAAAEHAGKMGRRGARRELWSGGSGCLNEIVGCTDAKTWSIKGLSVCVDITILGIYYVKTQFFQDLVFIYFSVNLSYQRIMTSRIQEESLLMPLTLWNIAPPPEAGLELWKPGNGYVCPLKSHHHLVFYPDVVCLMLKQ